ncbi:PH domain-containing protein [Planomicrobium sp. YIM 101495]|uniref:PH domain-containing protein n=1 Tax=Planomicrobium sp. YIM 101495 TaxID=2665160 RepID=UPI0012B8F35D|nr:PH domain-containing protein [Planomicrobium sp. YIM 101495]
MIAKRRHHPASILFKYGLLVRNLFFLFLILFIFNRTDPSTIITYGRYAFLAYLAYSIVSTLLTWLTSSYALDAERFHLYNGIFNKTERTIPFAKVQNINRHTSFFHKVLGLTSIRFETATAGEEASVKFDVLTKKGAARIEEIVEAKRKPEVREETEIGAKEDDAPSAEIPLAKPKAPARTIHFRPTTRELVKASFTSFSFLLLVPLLGSLYYNISDFINLEDRVDGLVGDVMSSGWIIAATVLVILLASLAFGIFQTFRKYGKYEIASDDKRIYIQKGILSETSFSIAKDRVQAIEVNQSFIKRLLGLAEVKLISAGSLSLGEDNLDISSLYPFLPKAKAYAIVSELLPSYTIQEEMERLPRRSLWLRMLKPSWLWIIVTALLVFFKPDFFRIEQTWWIASALLLVLIIMSRVLDFLHTRFCLNGQLIQFKTGGFTTSLFVTKREKVIEVKVTQNGLQRLFGLRSLETVTRAKPVHHSYLTDAPETLASDFHQWYRERTNEIELEPVE